MLKYIYTFELGNGAEKVFTVNLNRRTLDLIDPQTASPPEWARLDNFQCPNCPLRIEEHPYCPVSVSIAELVDFFKDFSSYEEARVTVESESRTFVKRTSLQQGVSALMGLLMATSGCPVLEKLKPMVRHHLPFSTKDETLYRVLSMYLLSQYFNYMNGKTPDWDLHKLAKIYNEIHIVNESFWKRLSHIAKKDADVNALIILDVFAAFITLKLEDGQLSEIELLCASYFD